MITKDLRLYESKEKGRIPENWISERASLILNLKQFNRLLETSNMDSKHPTTPFYPSRTVYSLTSARQKSTWTVPAPAPTPPGNSLLRETRPTHLGHKYRSFCPEQIRLVILVHIQ